MLTNALSDSGNGKPRKKGKHLKQIHDGPHNGRRGQQIASTFSKLRRWCRGNQFRCPSGQALNAHRIGGVPVPQRLQKLAAFRS